MLEIKKHKNLNYVISKPDDFNGDLKYPTLIFFHGAGTRGNDIDLLKNNLFFKKATHSMDKCVMFAPHCTNDSWFDIFEQVLDFCEFVSQCDYVDKNRVYLMGASMGGYAVWQLAMSKPNLFAAIAPICGGGMYWNAFKLKNMPIWAFHGEDDDCVFVEESIKMVDAVNKKGGNAKLTIYKNTGHDAWSATYDNTEVFDWLFSNAISTHETLRTNLDDVKKYG